MVPRCHDRTNQGCPRSRGAEHARIGLSANSLDQGTPHPLRGALTDEHEISPAFERGWSRLKNGELLDVAQGDGFDLLVTTDSHLKNQQNLTQRRIVRLSRIPVEVLKRYEKWKDVVQVSGPAGLRLIKGFHDEALRGEWRGYRSSRLGEQ